MLYIQYELICDIQVFIFFKYAASLSHAAAISNVWCSLGM